MNVATAKNFFESQVKRVSTKIETANVLPYGDPNWDSAYTKELSIGTSIAVPLKMESYSQWGNEKVKGYDYLLVYKIADGSLHHEVVSVIPRTSYESVSGFSGMVIVRDWSGRIVRGFNYKDGAYVPASIKIGGIRSASTEKEAPCQEPSVTVCIRWENGMGIDCTWGVPVSGCGAGGGDFPSGGGSWGGEPGGGGPDPGNYPTGGPGSGGSNTGNEITDQLTTPCFKNVLYEVNSISLQNAVSKILTKFFSLGIKLKLTFREAVLDPKKDGETGGIIYSNGDADLVITLNSSGLKSASKEYVAATLYHEIIHAYFNLRGKHPLEDPNYLQHQEMAGFYADNMAQGIRELYPNISKDDAEALAWGGLETSLAYKAIVRDKPALANSIAQTNFDYRGGASGTKCK